MHICTAHISTTFVRKMSANWKDKELIFYKSCTDFDTNLWKADEGFLQSSTKKKRMSVLTVSLRDYAVVSVKALGKEKYIKHIK